MPSYFTILSATLPVFLIVAVGFFFHRRGWLSEETEMGMMKIVLNLLIPCLVLSLIPGNSALEAISSAAWAIGLGIVLTIGGFFLAWFGGLAGGMRTGSGLRTFTISAGIQNYGFIPLPILVALFPGNAGPSGLVFVFGVGVEIAMWTVGLAIMNGKMGLRSLFNGPFIAVLAALLLNYSGGYLLVPGVVATTMEMLGRCAVPISIFMVGATMGRFFTKGILTDIFRVGIVSIVVRLGLHAALILAAAVFLTVSPDLKHLLVVQAAMPAAIFPIFLVRLFGGQTPIAIQVVVVTSCVGLLTAPLVIGWGLQWVNG